VNSSRAPSLEHFGRRILQDSGSPSSSPERCRYSYWMKKEGCSPLRRLRILANAPYILDSGSWVKDFCQFWRIWILATPYSEFWLRMLDSSYFSFWILVADSGFGFWILAADFGYWLRILDSGYSLFWILAADSGFWLLLILDSGCRFWLRILDSGCGFWILVANSGFWLRILDSGFGFWILGSKVNWRQTAHL